MKRNRDDVIHFNCTFPHMLFSCVHILYTYVYKFIKKGLQEDMPADNSSDCFWKTYQRDLGLYL